MEAREVGGALSDADRLALRQGMYRAGTSDNDVNAISMWERWSRDWLRSYQIELVAAKTRRAARG